MDDIIRIKNASYARYEEVLMQRDNLKKEAFILQRSYVAEFGDLILSVFEKKLECIRKKKTIEFMQASLNHGKPIDQDALQAYLKAEMAAFQAQLDAMIEDTKSAKERETVTELDLLKIKRLYHRLVKQIHPDINPRTNELEELSDLWNRVQAAYNCNDLKELEELEVIVTSALQKLGIGIMEIEIPDIEDKIAEIEAEIVKIRETDPYMYKYLLEDPEAVAEKNKALQEELRSYEDYSAQLGEILDGLMTNGVRFVWRMN